MPRVRYGFRATFISMRAHHAVRAMLLRQEDQLAATIAVLAVGARHNVVVRGRHGRGVIAPTKFVPHEFVRAPDSEHRRETAGFFAVRLAKVCAVYRQPATTRRQSYVSTSVLVLLAKTSLGVLWKLLSSRTKLCSR